MTSTAEKLSSASSPGYEARLPKGFPGLPPGWISSWETFPASDAKLQLFGVLHRREPWTGHRALLVVHGMGEHGGRYAHLPHYLHSVVDAIFCVDQRGHGRSEGLRGHVDRFDVMTDDVAEAVRRLDERLRAKFGKSEIHLLGHSMGGTVALRTLFLHPKLPLASAVISAPLLGILAKVPMPKKLAAKALANIWGSLQLPTGLDVTAIARDPAVVEAYRSDRLIHDKMTPKFYQELLAAMADTLSRETGISVPLLMTIPLADRIVDAERSQGFFKALKSRDKVLKTYSGFFHEPMNDVGKEEVFGDISAWIAAHGAS